MGIACPQPNAIGCDRLGLAVWLRRPALAVTATVGGRAFRLDWAGDRPPRFAGSEPRTAFDGFLQPARLVSRLHVEPDPGGGWAPSPENSPAPLVVLRIVWPGDTLASATRLHVGLAGGWG